MAGSKCLLDTSVIINSFRNDSTTISQLYTFSEIFIDPEELQMHHVLSDIKADINWKNFEKLFDKFFEEDIARTLTGRSIVEFSDGMRLFTHDELQHIYQNRKRS